MTSLNSNSNNNNNNNSNLEEWGEATNNKRGHTCCGFCCDVRRAVIVVSGVNLILTLIVLSLLISLKRAAQELEPSSNTTSTTFTNTTTANTEELDQVREMEWGTIALYSSLAMVGCIFGIVGAILFNKYMVAVATVPLMFDLVAAIFSLNYTFMIIYLLFIYPHVCFIQEVHQGIMSKETYETNERHSCCCV